ncbi:glycosyltransferase family 2 protein [Nafulsella turpanensis]|uniref:glycosyltransferase family 2 protein n=1 Tax=Nafulsella turpanensis TaxID=1265690 RepID=UPI000349FD80|nr:glycosyltransferase family 2 protein [Nafulsella turpanensis]
MIFIVIPVFNRRKFTFHCLAGLLCQTYKDFRIIVVDHGSSDGTEEMITTGFPEVLLVRGTEDLWWAGATNVGIQRALEMSQSDSDFVLTLNNDLEVEENYLTELLQVNAKNKTAIIGSISVDINNREKIVFSGVQWNRITAKYKSVVDTKESLKAVQDRNSWVSTDLLPGRGVLIPIKCIKNVGLFDQVNFPHYLADEEFSLRCMKHGYKTLVATKAVVYSYSEETGLKQSHFKKDLGYWKAYFTSIKSPCNLKYRWRWAIRNTPFPVLYFCIDLARMTYSQLKMKASS